jgi:hypothetical protein
MVAKWRSRLTQILVAGTVVLFRFRTSNPKVVGSNPTGRAFATTTYDDSGSRRRIFIHAFRDLARFAFRGVIAWSSSIRSGIDADRL